MITCYRHKQRAELMFMPMKILNRLWCHSGMRFLSLLTLSGSLTIASGQTVLPIVRVYATDPHASWSGDTGTVQFFRDGPTNAELNVFYWLRGTATNGVDYVTLGNSINIPAGVHTSSLTVTPLNSGQTDTRTVQVQLGAPPTLPPINYVI